MIFSTSDILYQMCYCCRKLDFQWNVQNLPQMYRESASNVWIGLKCTALWLAQTQNSVDSLYIWGQFCTFEAEIIYFVMWSVWANQTAVHLRHSQSHRIGFKCTESASNVQNLADFTAARTALPGVYIWGRLDSTNPQATVAPLPANVVRAAVKSARLAWGSDSLAR